MPMRDWIDKYPQVKQLLQQKEPLLYEPDSSSTGTLGSGAGSDYPPARPAAGGDAASRFALTHFRLEGRDPVPEPDSSCWSRWFAMTDRHVRGTWVVSRSTGQAVRVSTVFLGLNHQHRSGGPPLLFETMVFGAEALADVCERYTTWQEAEDGHRSVCLMVREWLDSQG